MEEERNRFSGEAGPQEGFGHCDQGGKTWRLFGCTAVRAELEEGDLTFFCPDGIWLPAEHKKNPAGHAVRTGAAKVCYRLAGGDCAVYVYKEKKDGRALRKTRTAGWLLKELNGGKACLEFGGEYRFGARRIIECLLRKADGRDAHPCELRLEAEKLYYFWNDMPGAEALPACGAPAFGGDGGAEDIPPQAGAPAFGEDGGAEDSPPRAGAFAFDEDDDAGDEMPRATVFLPEETAEAPAAFRPAADSPEDDPQAGAFSLDEDDDAEG